LELELFSSKGQRFCHLPETTSGKDNVNDLISASSPNDLLLLHP